MLLLIYHLPLLLPLPHHPTAAAARRRQRTLAHTSHKRCIARARVRAVRTGGDIMDCFAEAEGKRVHDPNPKFQDRSRAAPATGFPAENVGRFLEVFGPVIVGAGPVGLAVAALLGLAGVPYVLLERCGCIASLWRHRTYDRLRLHLPVLWGWLGVFLEYIETYASRTYANSERSKSNIAKMFLKLMPCPS